MTISGIDVTDLAMAKKDAKKAGIRLKVELLHGPGGGHPMVKLVGPKQKLIRLLEQWGYGDEAWC